MMDILFYKLINRFEGMKSVVRLYQLLEPSFLSNASHLDLEVEARKFSNKFSDSISPLFPCEMLSIKTSFREKIAHLKSAKAVVLNRLSALAFLPVRKNLFRFYSLRSLDEFRSKTVLEEY